MDGGTGIEWEATSNGLACRISAEVSEEILHAIRADFLAAMRGGGLPVTAINVVPRGWRRYKYRWRTIMILRDPLPLSLQSEQSPMRQLLHQIVIKHLNN